MPPPPTVCVITAATGHPNLGKCIESVQEQTYAMIEHLVVIDGPECAPAVDASLANLKEQRGLSIVRLPYATGGDSWAGHRIYGAMPSIARSDFVCWLNESNWLEEDHIESLIATARSAQANWSFALRKIVDAAGQFVANDECESLGNLHPTFQDPNDFLIDSNCYLLQRALAVQLSGIWNRPAVPSDGGPQPDRMLCRVLMEHFPNGQSTRKHTVNYTPAGPPPEFFVKGNEIMRSKYPQGFPWEVH